MGKIASAISGWLKRRSPGDSAQTPTLPKVSSSALHRLSDYHHKALILRQIMSQKAHRNLRLAMYANVGTVIVSGFLTFIGFSGLDKMQRYAGWVREVDGLQVELVFNLLVLSLFLLVILQLIFRFEQNHNEAFRAVAALARFTNELQDRVLRLGPSSDQEFALLENTRDKYDAITSTLPSNTDREFRRAKRNYEKKSLIFSELKFSIETLRSPEAQRVLLESIVYRSVTVMGLLRSIRQIDHRLFLGGGVVRNCVWDFLHNYVAATPIDDVDVVYFDLSDTSKLIDDAFAARLKAISPNFQWSVKNQARMHLSNGEAAYGSFFEAISKWPETATAIAVRLRDDESLEIVAPHGLSDLFRLLVTPSPWFIDNLARYRERVSGKQWPRIWPNLRITHLPDVRSDDQNSGGRPSHQSKSSGPTNM